MSHSRSLALTAWRKYSHQWRMAPENLLGAKNIMSQGGMAGSTFPSASRTLNTSCVAFVEVTNIFPSVFVLTDETP